MTAIMGGFAPPCIHGQPGGEQFCVFCLRKRGDDAWLICATLANVLLAVEWIDDEVNGMHCPCCGSSQFLRPVSSAPKYPNPTPHAADCALDVALRRAGVR